MSEKVSNEQIYALLKLQEERFSEFKADIKEFKADVNRQFGEIREEIHEIKQEQRETRHRFDRLSERVEVMDQRLYSMENKINRIHITWSTRLVGGILGTSAITSAIVAYFIIHIT